MQSVAHSSEFVGFNDHSGRSIPKETFIPHGEPEKQ